MAALMRLCCAPASLFITGLQSPFDSLAGLLGISQGRASHGKQSSNRWTIIKKKVGIQLAIKDSGLDKSVLMKCWNLYRLII